MAFKISFNRGWPNLRDLARANPCFDLPGQTHGEYRLPDGSYAAIGPAWQSQAGPLEHIWSNDMPFDTYNFVAGKRLKHPVPYLL